MSKEVLILDDGERRSLEVALRTLKKEYLRDKVKKRPTIVNGIILNDCLVALKMDGLTSKEILE